MGDFYGSDLVVPHITSVDIPLVRGQSQGHACCKRSWEMTSCLSKEKKKVPLVTDQQSCPRGKCSHHKYDQQDLDLVYVIFSFIVPSPHDSAKLLPPRAPPPPILGDCPSLFLYV